MAEPQSISRSAVMPVVVTLSIASVVLALLVASVADSEYSHFEGEAQEKGDVWPSFSKSTKSVPFLGLLLVFSTIGFGVRLLRNSECRLATLLWYGSVAIIAHLLWLTVSFVSVYVLYLRFYH
jgi:hypothetical protein